LAVASDE
jgi:hypothetical protein